MAFDTIIEGGTVVDGSGLPMRSAGLIVMPGIIDVHTHYDPQLSFDPFATSSCFHGVTSVVAGNCGYSIAPCRSQDHDWLTGLFAKVEGMSPNVLRSGLPWDWDSFPSFIEALDKRLGINAAFYVGHSALRRFVMGDAASERAATADETEHMKRLVREAMGAGAAGFSSSHGPTHVDQFKRPVPSRFGDFEEVATLAAVAGEGGAGSIAYLPESGPAGLNQADRDRLIVLARRSGLPVVIQGMGYRPGKRDAWEDQTRFLSTARAQGAAIYSMLRTQPFMRPFNWKRGTSLFDGVFHWRDLADLGPEDRLARMRDPDLREKLRWGIDHPNTDSSKGSTLPMPAMTAVFVDRSASDPTTEGKSLAQLASARGVHPADVMCDLAVGDGLETQFLWNSENPAWIEANAESQRNLHMIVGTGDGGAHADRDDGAEWSTYYIRSWLLDRQVFTLEDGIRRLTHLPAMVTGIKGRGLLARGYHADIMMFDPQRIALGRKHLVRDMPGGEERWQVGATGIVRVLVNGQTIVENNTLTGARPGRALRIGNAPQ
jgi:N-acyl-D-amino-acid deacylase